MQTQSAMRESGLNSLHGGTGTVFKMLLAVGVTLGAATTQAAQGDATYTVTGQRSVGDVKIGVSIGGGAATVVPVHVGLAPKSPSDYATEIAQGLGNGARAVGGKVIVPGTTPGGNRILTSVQLNRSLVVKTNVDDFVLGRQPAGVLYFAQSPIAGRSILDTDVVISAGFANGLVSVTFTESAGESIDDAASRLNAALDSAGYVTSLIDPRDVEVFADGATGPTELDFTVTPTADGIPADDDILYGTITVPVPVPEPEGYALMLTGLGLSGLLARRRKGAVSLTIRPNPGRDA